MICWSLPDTAGPEQVPKLLNTNPTLFIVTMSRELALSLLRQGENGDQILEILETIVTPEAQYAEPTAEEIQF